MDLTSELAKALGLPKHLTKAVLTLEAGKAPRIDVTMLMADRAGSGFVLTAAGDEIRRINFSYRLVRFGEA